MRKNISISLLSILLMAFISACSAQPAEVPIETQSPPTAQPSKAPEPTNTPTALPTASATPTPKPAFPGTYSTTFTTDDNPEDKTLVGDWIWTFATANNNTVEYSLNQDGDRMWEGEGTITLDGDQLTILTTTSKDIGSDCVTEGTYNWTFDENQLIFTVISDTCKGRIFIMTNQRLVSRP